ncbi:MAG: TonB family protein [Steroidobacteraceae bacterium]
MSEVWTKWEGECIDGTFPLRRLLSGSDHSGVFLAENTAQNLSDVAIKILPADPALAEAQLSHWKAAAALSHPHLVQLLGAGRCQLGGRPFLFVVMEYAEQTLSQILPKRALSPDEVWEMLPPVLDALAFLHGRNLVQGRLKPSNLLVVNDRLKLASDTIRAAGESMAGGARSCVYDPPEAMNGASSTAGDVWALGITLVEALTQQPPAWPEDRSETVSLPPGLPPALVDTVRRCLCRDPAERATVGELEAQCKRPPQAPVNSIPEPFAPAPPDRAAPPKNPSMQRLIVPTIAALLILLVVVWAGSRLHQDSPSHEQADSGPSRIPSPQPAPPAVLPAAEASANPPPSVLHEEIPQVPRSARDTIHGRIDVTVRVTVDGSGNVVDEALERPGPSNYFARLATAAARKWKFAPADNQGSRGWIVSFEFTRSGTTGRAAAARP